MVLILATPGPVQGLAVCNVAGYFSFFVLCMGKGSHGTLQTMGLVLWTGHAHKTIKMYQIFVFVP